MSLVVSGSGAIPIWMEPQDGNSSDKQAFHETIKKVRSFQKQLQGCPEFKWVADSALYSKEKLLKQSEYLWVSRVPETIKEARELIEKEDQEIKWKEQEKGYKTAEFYSNYGEVKQRWLLIYSEQSYHREKKTFDKKLKKQDDILKKALWHLGNEVFLCEADAIKSSNKITKKFPYHQTELKIIPVVKHKKFGRPKKEEKGEIIGHQVQSEIKRNEKEVGFIILWKE